MRLLFSLFLIGLVFSPSAAFSAEKVNYWLIDVPVMKGAQNVKREREHEYFMSGIRYELSVKDHKSVFEFYRKIFKSKGWKDFLEGHPSSGKDWQGYSHRVLGEGKAVASYVASWVSPNEAFSAKVSLKFTDYVGGIFKSEIAISITPNRTALSMDGAEILHRDLFQDPRDIFIFAKAFKVDLSDITKLDFSTVPAEYKNEKVVLSYQKIQEQVLSGYKKFGAQYVDYDKIPKP